MTTAISKNKYYSYYNEQNAALPLKKTSTALPHAVKASLVEVGIGGAFVAITLPFIATGIGQIILTVVSIGLLAKNVLLRLGDPGCTTNSRSFRARLFSIIDLATRDVLTHESGHALAVKAFLKGADPVVTISPFGGGMTTWIDTQKLSTLGRYLGYNRSMMAIFAAGTGLSLLFALAGLTLAHKMQLSHPEASAYLSTSSKLSILGSFIYSLSALVNDDAGHDFAFLAAGGIHPLAAAAFVITLPFLLVAYLRAYDPQE